MRILMTGATGFIGSALVARWNNAGHTITALVREEARARNLLGPDVKLTTELASLPKNSEFDAVCNLAGAPIAGGLWTKARRKLLLESRVGTTNDLISFISALEKKPQVMISASAAGYYGRRGQEWLNEEALPQNIFMSTLCRAWEDAAAKVEAFGVRLVSPRVSVVLGRSGGAFPALVRPMRFGLGARFGAGDHYFPWIHKEDLLALFDHMLEQESLSGPVNATAPETVTQYGFNQTVAEILVRPNFISVPKGLVKIGLGELSDLFISGQRLTATKALESGFEFQYPTLKEAIKNLLL